MSRRKSKSKKPIDYFARNKKSRTRGYAFEHWLVQKIESYETKWHARRLGGTSTNMPDILAVNNQQSRMLAIEAKSGMDAGFLYIPKDEIERCVELAKMFEIYKDRKVLFSFKFSEKNTFHARYYHFILTPEAYAQMDSFKKLWCSKQGVCIFVFDVELGETSMRLPAFDLDSLGVFQVPRIGY